MEEFDFLNNPHSVYECEGIDPNLKNIIFLLNKYGLRTKYCCEGHREEDKLYIMFHENIKDEQIEKFIKDIYDYAKFIKTKTLLSTEVYMVYIYVRILKNGLEYMMVRYI